MDRLACVDVPALPLQLLLQMHPEWLRLPVAVVEDDRPQALVLFNNDRARKAGVRTGHRYAAALALAPDLRAAVVSRSQIDERVRALADGLRRYSPHVEPSTNTPGLFWLDASGLNRLYASLEEWAAAVRLEMQRAGVRATVAVGVSRFGTYALAKYHPGITVCLDPADERGAVDRVPIAALDLDPDARDRLQALGIKTVGEFLRLPGDALRQRLGPAADAVFKLASGRTWAPLAPVPAEERHERQLDFDAPETNTERVLFVVKRLLDALIGELSRRAHAIACLTLNLTLDNRTQQAEHVRPATPTLDAAQLLTLVRLRLDALRLASGIVVASRGGGNVPGRHRSSCTCCRRAAAIRTRPIRRSRGCAPSLAKTPSCARACAMRICPGRGLSGSRSCTCPPRARRHRGGRSSAGAKNFREARITSAQPKPSSRCPTPGRTLCRVGWVVAGRPRARLLLRRNGRRRPRVAVLRPPEEADVSSRRRRMNVYVPLWCKSNGSFLEGASHPEELVEQAAALGLPAIAITDRDGVYGIVRAHVKAKECGITLIVGAQVTIEGTADRPASTIVLLATNRRGYANLCRLITLGRRRKPKGESGVTWTEVCEHESGVIALWGGDTSAIVREAGVDDAAAMLRDAFGDRVYAMAARHRREIEVVEEARLRARAARFGMPVAAAVEVLYHVPERAGAAGRDDVHPSRSHSAHGRHAPQAERGARTVRRRRLCRPLRRRSRVGLAHQRNCRAL